MIYAYVGKPGTGKSYALMKVILKALSAGKNVYVNFFVDEEKIYNYLSKKRKNKPIGQIFRWYKISDLVPVRQGEIIMDEAQIWLRSRNWKDLPPEFEYKLQQHRKHGLNLYLAVQNIKRIDVVARELVSSIFEFKRIGFFFMRREYDIEEIDKVNRTVYSVSFYFLNKKIASFYDTFQEIKS